MAGFMFKLENKNLRLMEDFQFQENVFWENIL